MAKFFNSFMSVCFHLHILDVQDRSCPMKSILSGTMFKIWNGTVSPQRTLLMQLHELLQNFQGSETLVQSYLRLLIVGQLVEYLSFNFVLNIYLIHKKKILGFFLFDWLIFRSMAMTIMMWTHTVVNRCMQKHLANTHLVKFPSQVWRSQSQYDIN